MHTPWSRANPSRQRLVYGICTRMPMHSRFVSCGALCSTGRRPCAGSPAPKRFREVLAISKLAHQINEDIRDKEVRLIDEGGEQLGIVSCQDALNTAYEKDLDLVKISPGAKPPVCKIMDYGKYKFEQSKRDKEQKRNQHIVEIKEIRMSPVIDTNDFNCKLRSGQKFLKEGNRLKVTIRFRGRQMAHTEIGAGILERFAEACAEIANLDKNPKLEGRNMSMFLSPKAAKPEKAEKAEPGETEEESKDE